MASENNRHLVCDPSIFVHQYKVVCEFKLEFQSGNAQFGSKASFFFYPCDLEVWQMAIGHLFYTPSSVVHQFVAIHELRAPFLCPFKLCALFRSHMWIQTGVTDRKRSIRVKIVNFLAHVTLKFDGWPLKTIGHLLYATMHQFVAIYVIWNWSYSPETLN